MSKQPLIPVLRNYRHASRIFVDSNFRLSPKFGFLFYVEFDFNPLITNVSNTSAQEMGMIVKSVNLPKYSIQVKEHNAYNRKNYVQNSIKYDPISIAFHDDQSDNVLNFWYDYYSYYYRDPDYADATYSAVHKYQSRPTFDWGYTPRAAIGYNSSRGAQPYQYIQAIRIYSLYQGQFSEYELINPIITNFKHGDLNNSEGNSLLQHEMSVQFETVKYLSGSTTTDTAGGFIDLHYDTTPSPNIADGGPAGQVPQYKTNSDQITDFANNSNTTALEASQSLKTTVTSGNSNSTASALAGLQKTMDSYSPNSGGSTIPGLGSLTQGITSSNMLGQQLATAGVSIAGGTASSFANGITAGTSQQGMAVIGLAAAALSNPSQTLKTVESMAGALALGFAVNAATGFVNQGVNIVGATVASSLTDLGTNLGYAAGTIGQAASDFITGF